jgi:YegS/Rv2252/BmrU family lipid kinase
MQEENWYIIVNPAAGNGAGARVWQRIRTQLLQALPNAVEASSTYPGHATELAAAAIQQGYRHLIGVGGDGTNNEVINGVFQQTEVPASAITYALLPIGTGNDWVRTHRIPRRIEAWLKMLQNKRYLLHDIGLVQFCENGETRQRYFINVAGMAYDAFVVAFANQYKKWIVHKILYLLMVLRCLLLYRLPLARVHFNGHTEKNFYYTINVGIARYSGGGMQLVPHANPTDGLLALTLARRVSKLGVLLNTWRFYNGSLHRHPKIDIFQTKEVQVDSDNLVYVEADGELLGHTPVRFSILPQALRVLVP